MTGAVVPNGANVVIMKEEVELIGMPFENILELSKISKSDNPFNNAFENQLIFEKSLLINTLFKNLNNNDFFQNKKEILQFNEFQEL